MGTMANKVTKHNHNDDWQKTVISTRKMQMRLLSTRTMPNEVSKHKNDANETSK